MPDTDLLKNKIILVTRPAGLADSLLQRIKEYGGTGLHYPVINICSIENSNSVLADLATFDIAIFISPTAVLQTLQKTSSFPDSLTIAAIGRSTASALSKHGLTVRIVPDNFNTESLLQHSEFQSNKVSNKSIVIFRGVGGRDLLADTLKQRGAVVTYIETYQRTKNNLAPLSDDQLANIDMLTISSNQGLQFLFDLTGNKAALTALPIMVPGERASRLALQLGFSDIIQASNATDDAYLHSLIAYFKP